MPFAPGVELIPKVMAPLGPVVNASVVALLLNVYVLVDDAGILHIIFPLTSYKLLL